MVFFGASAGSALFATMCFFIHGRPCPPFGLLLVNASGFEPSSMCSACRFCLCSWICLRVAQPPWQISISSCSSYSTPVFLRISSMSLDASACEVFPKRERLACLFRQGLQVRRLGVGHRLVPRHPFT